MPLGGEAVPAELEEMEGGECLKPLGISSFAGAVGVSMLPPGEGAASLSAGSGLSRAMLGVSRSFLPRQRLNVYGDGDGEGEGEGEIKVRAIS